MRAVLVAVPSLSLLAACLDEPALRRPPQIVRSSLDDGGDRVSPTAPLWIELDLPPDPESVSSATVLLVQGAADQALLADLAHPPLDEGRRERLVPGRIEVAGERIQLQPLRPLVGEALHTLVLTPQVTATGVPLRRPWSRGFASGPREDGAATLALVDPSPTSGPVVRNLRSLTVGFSRAVAGVDATTLRLIGAGAPTAAVVALGDGRRYRLDLAAALAPRTTYRIVAGDGIVDSAGAPPFAFAAPPEVTTSDELRRTPPRLGPPVASVGSGCLVVRLVSEPAVAIRLCADGRCVTGSLRRTDHEIAMPSLARAFSVLAWDESTAPPIQIGPLPAPAPSPRSLVISEVLANPLGAVPEQQFVELHNPGRTPIATDGLTLHDEQGGDALPPAIIAAGGYALVVGEGYRTDGADAAPRPGTLLLRLSDRYLGGNGIRQSGEAIGLFDEQGRPLSRISTAAIRVADGQSVRRRRGGCDVASSFEASPDGASSPGGP